MANQSRLLPITVGEKYAALFGCNYPGQFGELFCCYKDCAKIKEMLIKFYGFSSQNVRIYLEPTGQEIVDGITRLVLKGKRKDTLFTYFSGHGSRVETTSGLNNTGYHECLLGGDWDAVPDVTIRAITEDVPVGCSFTFMSDSCHSGGLIEGAAEEIGFSTLPADMYLFEQPEDVTKRKLGILLSACQSHEVTKCSHEISFFTEAILEIVKETEGMVTNKKLIFEAKARLNNKGFKQTPGLYCSAKQASMLFLGDDPLDLL